MRNLPEEGDGFSPRKSLESHRDHTSVVPGGGQLQVRLQVRVRLV
jgi:hypothetical protein